MARRPAAFWNVCRRNISYRARSRCSASKISRHGLVFLVMLWSFACQCISFSNLAFANSTLSRDLRNCVEREAKRELDKLVINFDNAFENEIDPKDVLDKIYDSTIDIENDVIKICSPQTDRETVQSEMYTGDPTQIFINTRVVAIRDALVLQKANTADEKLHKKQEEAKQQELEAQRRKAEEDAPRLKAEKEEESQAASTYLLCLKEHAKLLSRNSSESAEVIVEASFASCPAERHSIFEAFKRHDESLNEDDMRILMETFDGRARPALLLEVIKARASPIAPPSPAPTPTKPDTPI